MKELRGRVAVVTGAASGIGRALAERFAAEGMKVVLADLDAQALARTERELARDGVSLLAVPTDVASGASVEALAHQTREAFGAVHVLCNNAGVSGAGGPLWTLSERDWEWILSVNLMGVVHGIRAFVPWLIESGDEGHVVNTGSLAGLASPAFFGPYVAAKHAVVALSEVLARDLQAMGARVKVSVLCPGFVRTGIADSERHRPSHLRNAPTEERASPVADAVDQTMHRLIATGLDPSEVADHVVAAIREERFYVLPHPEAKAAVQARMTDIVND